MLEMEIARRTTSKKLAPSIVAAVKSHVPKINETGTIIAVIAEKLMDRGRTEISAFVDCFRNSFSASSSLPNRFPIKL